MEKLLIIVDMQNDFIDGKLPNEAAAAIIPFIKDLLKESHYHKVYFTRDTHYTSDKTVESATLPEHCLHGTFGWEVTEELESCVDKPTYVNKGAFGANWEYELSDVKPSSIDLVGTCTDICVISNALALRSLYPELPITVYMKGCAATDDEGQAAAKLIMQKCLINVVE